MTLAKQTGLIVLRHAQVLEERSGIQGHDWQLAHIVQLDSR